MCITEKHHCFVFIKRYGSVFPTLILHPYHHGLWQFVYFNCCIMLHGISLLRFQSSAPVMGFWIVSTSLLLWNCCYKHFSVCLHLYLYRVFTFACSTSGNNDGVFSNYFSSSGSSVYSLCMMKMKQSLNKKVGQLKTELPPGGTLVNLTGMWS